MTAITIIVLSIAVSAAVSWSIMRFLEKRRQRTWTWVLNLLFSGFLPFLLVACWLVFDHLTEIAEWEAGGRTQPWTGSMLSLAFWFFPFFLLMLVCCLIAAALGRQRVK